MVTEDTAQLYNPKVIQSTMGSCFRVRVEKVDVESVLSNQKLPIVGALLEGENMYQSRLPTAGFLIIGNESKGIRPNLKSLITHPISIPNFGQAESLNAAVATGIILAQWRS
jgi:TrmH family RNA methyltransferase